MYEQTKQTKKKERKKKKSLICYSICRYITCQISSWKTMIQNRHNLIPQRTCFPSSRSLLQPNLSPIQNWFCASFLSPLHFVQIPSTKHPLRSISPAIYYVKYPYLLPSDVTSSSRPTKWLKKKKKHLKISLWRKLSKIISSLSQCILPFCICFVGLLLMKKNKEVATTFLLSLCTP